MLEAVPARQLRGGGRGDPVVGQHQLEPVGVPGCGQLMQDGCYGVVLVVPAGTTKAASGRPVTSTATMRLAPLVRPYTRGPSQFAGVVPPLLEPRARWVSMTTMGGRGARPAATRARLCLFGVNGSFGRALPLFFGA